MNPPITLRKRKRPMPDKVSMRDANGKPIAFEHHSGNYLDSQSAVLSFIRCVVRDSELTAKPLVVAECFEEGAVGLLRHYRIDDVARETGISRKELMQLANRERKPLFHEVFRIFDAFNLDLKLSTRKVPQ